MERVQIIRGLGMTERKAVAEAWARLKMQGYVVLDDPPPAVEVKCDDTGALVWFVTFEVQEPTPRRG